jgi:O-acetylhomoserine (thiol)-lyase
MSLKKESPLYTAGRSLAVSSGHAAQFIAITNILQQGDNFL